jgi:hypothetical protein
MLQKLSLAAGFFALTTVVMPQTAPAAFPQSKIPAEMATGATLVHAKRHCTTKTFRHYHNPRCWHTDVRTCCRYGQGRPHCTVRHHHDRHCGPSAMKAR